jgi:hypothetical protein
MSSDEGFLARWSRRKAEHRLPSGSDSPGPSADPAPDVNFPDGSSGEPEADLDCTSLEFSSDFSRFVCDGVSTVVQTAALRRLWVTSSLFSVSDGLDVYRGDYSTASPIGDISAAASRVLQVAVAEQSAADQPASSLTATSDPQNELASGAEKEKSQTPQVREPQATD